MIRPAILSLALAIAHSSAVAAAPVELAGSPASMARQHAVAVKSDVRFARTSADIDRMLDSGELVRLLGNEHYDLREGLGSDAARPEVRLFVERLAEEYLVATGEKLVVTSLTRPSLAQPPNAHVLSIHPTGLALDLRISQRAASRQWIEARLLGMEAQGLLDVTRERHPPHFHVALFPGPYLAYLEDLMGSRALEAALSGIEPQEEPQAEFVAGLDDVEAEPRRRRTLWSLLAGLFGRGR